jgi:hypothetical protein
LFFPPLELWNLCLFCCVLLCNEFFSFVPTENKNWCNAHQIVGRSQDDTYVPEASKLLPEAEPRAVYKDLKKQQVEFQTLFWIWFWTIDWHKI